MTIDALSERLTACADEALGFLRTEMNTVAETGKAMVIDRVSETGKDANGAQFKPYTEAYERRKRGAVGGVAREGKARRLARATGPATPDTPIGRYRGFVDFTLSGRMLTNIGLVEKDQGSKIVVVVSGRSEETRKKMEGNDNYRPGWFTLSKDEIGALKEQSAVRTGAFINKFLS